MTPVTHLCPHRPTVDWNTILSEDEDGRRTHPSVCVLCGLTGEHREGKARWLRREYAKRRIKSLTTPPEPK